MMSMTADVCDLDELATGKRREGIFGAIYWWMVKLGFAVADDREMANTLLLSDWQRGFPINRSPGVTSGASLTKSTYTPPTCG